MGFLSQFILSRFHDDIEKRVSAAKDEAFNKGVATGVERLTNELLQDAEKKALPRFYAMGNPWPYYVGTNPERKPRAMFDDRTLREIAKTCDPLRSCIEHIKREVVSTPIKLKGKNDEKVSETKIEKARELFENEGAIGERGSDRIDFEKQIVDDLLSIGCLAIGVEYTRGGDLYQAFAVDASTIRVAIDAYGFKHPTQPFEQWVMGLKQGAFDDTQVLYRGLVPQTSSPYFVAPIELMLRPVQRFLQVDDWNAAYFNISVAPEVFFGFPEEWDASQVAEFMKALEESTANDPTEKRKPRILPPNSVVKHRDRKDQDFSEYEPRIVKRICSIMGVQPASIGYEGDIYKVAQDAAHQQTSTFGVGAVLQIRKAIYDRLLFLAGFGDIEVVDVDEEKETPDGRTKRLKEASGGAYITVNEARAEEGRNPVEGGDVVRTPMAKPEQGQDRQDDQEGQPSKRGDLVKWQRKALARLRDGRSLDFEFESQAIHESESEAVRAKLLRAKTPEDVRSAFSGVKSHAYDNAD